MKQIAATLPLAVEVHQEAQTVSVDAHNVSYQEHVDRLYELIVAETTYTLLTGYNDDTLEPYEQFTKGQLEYCALQPKAPCDYFQTIILQNTGGASSWTLFECAQVAARSTYDKPSAATIQGWYNHKYVPTTASSSPTRPACTSATHSSTGSYCRMITSRVSWLDARQISAR